jgi:hypothetical protein
LVVEGVVFTFSCNVFSPPSVFPETAARFFCKEHSQLLLKKIRQTLKHNVVAQTGNVIDIKTNSNNASESIIED